MFSAYNVLHAELCAEDIAVNQINMVSIFMRLTVW